jgi:putative tricarboxylic transport membrane protein
MLADGIEYLTVMVGAYGLGEVLVRLEQGFATPPLETGGRVGTKFPNARRGLGDQADACAKLRARHHHGRDPGRRRDDRVVRLLWRRGQYCKRRKELGTASPKASSHRRQRRRPTVAGHMVRCSRSEFREAVRRR